MDGTLRLELDAADIIAAIMQDMEEVVDLIQRPISAKVTSACLVLPSSESEPSAIPDIS